jgi:hypothetical protein
MNAPRTKLKFLGLIALTLAGCAAGQAPRPTNEVQITGVLTRRGGQIEAFWGVRNTSREGGKLWHLEAKNASINEQLIRFQQKTVRVTGEATGDAVNAASLLPVLRILKIELVTQ